MVGPDTVCPDCKGECTEFSPDPKPDGFILYTGTREWIEEQKKLDAKFGQDRSPSPAVVHCGKGMCRGGRECSCPCAGCNPTPPANRMDAPDAPRCACGKPSTVESGWCGTGCEAVDRWAKGGILEFTKEEEALLSFAAPNLLSVLMREPPKEIEETRRRARQELSILLRRPR
jgi:hypothetical protein